jgi:hypothetical protein
MLRISKIHINPLPPLPEKLPEAGLYEETSLYYYIPIPYTSQYIFTILVYLCPTSKSAVTRVTQAAPSAMTWVAKTKLPATTCGPHKILSNVTIS